MRNNMDITCLSPALLFTSTCKHIITQPPHTIGSILHNRGQQQKPCIIIIIINLIVRIFYLKGNIISMVVSQYVHGTSRKGTLCAITWTCLSVDKIKKSLLFYFPQVPANMLKKTYHNEATSNQCHRASVVILIHVPYHIYQLNHLHHVLISPRVRDPQGKEECAEKCVLCDI